MTSKTSDNSMRIEAEIRKALVQARRRAAQGEVVILVVPVEEEGDPRLDRSWKKEFIKWRRQGRAVRSAAELAGVTERHVYRTYKNDPEFAQACDDVTEMLGHEGQ